MEIKDLFQKVKNVKDHYLNKKKKNDEIEEPDEGEESEDEQEKQALGVDGNEANKSMIHGDHGTIFGVSRPIVIGIGVFFMITFMMAFYYASTDDAPQQVSQEEMQKSQAEKIAGEKSVNQGDGAKLTSDYEKLRTSNTNKLQGGQQVGPDGRPIAQNGAGQNAQTVKAQQQQAPASQTVGNTPTVSAVPRATVVAPTSYAVPYQLASARQEAQQESSSDNKSVVARAEQELREKYKAAISFFGGSETANNDSGSTSGSTASQGVTAQTAVSSASAVYTAPTENMILSGTTIPMMLMTGINTDSPGVVYAQVLVDVYDSLGLNLMFPAGSQLVGKYESNANNGRVPVTFTTLITPDGGSWAIGDSIVAGDGTGYIGLQGTVHHHTAGKLRQGIFSSAITALSTLAADRVTLTGDALSALAGGTSSYKDTTTIDPGYTFNAYVVNNIAF